MSKHVLVIQGHPDAGERHFCHALEHAYAAAAMAAELDSRRAEQRLARLRRLGERAQ